MSVNLLIAGMPSDFLTSLSKSNQVDLTKEITIIDKIQDLDEWHNLPEDTHHILFYESPVSLLLRANGTNDWSALLLEPADTLALWQQFHHKLLEIYRNNSHNVMLIRIDRFFETSGKILIATIEKKWDFLLPLEISTVLNNLPNHYKSTTLFDENIMMAMLAQAFPQCYDLFIELESCGMLLNRDVELDMIASYNPALLPQQILLFSQKFERLAIQLHQSKRKIDDFVRLESNQSSQIVELKKSVDSNVAQNNKLQNNLKECSEINSTLIKEGDNFQSLILKTQQENKNLHETIKIQNKKISDLEQELTKKTQTLRDSEGESELLLLQLHQVQEELERYFLDYQDAISLLNGFNEIQIQNRLLFSQLINKSVFDIENFNPKQIADNMVTENA